MSEDLKKEVGKTESKPDLFPGRDGTVKIPAPVVKPGQKMPVKA